MSAYTPYHFRNNNFLLSANRTIFWEEEKSLILSDLHLGKSGHFRKSGIGIPQNIFKEDMQRLMAEIQFYKPIQLIIVGDLFHSAMNKEHDLFLKWRHDINSLPIHLIKGNHDILKLSWYEQAGLTVHKTSYTINDFSFMHDINECEPAAGSYCFSGHIHPGVRLRGMGRQSLQFPCFYFGKEYAVLPAFGKFTGTYPVESEPGDAVFALVENSVMQLQ